MKKKFDCIESSRKWKQEISEKIKDMSSEERIEYFNGASKRFLKASKSKKRMVRSNRKSLKPA